MPDPRILNPHDAIVRVTATAICGWDLHLYDGFTPPCTRATSSATSSWARRMGQTHAQKYMRPRLERIRRGDLDPTFVISHRLHLVEAPWAYRTFRDKADDSVQCVLKP